MSTFAVYGKSGTELFDHTYTYTHIDTLALIGNPLAGKASALQARDAVERLRLRPGTVAAAAFTLAVSSHSEQQY